MGVTLGHCLWENTEWLCLRKMVLRGIFEPARDEAIGNEENCILRSFIICYLCLILLDWMRQEESYHCGIKERNKKYIQASYGQFEWKKQLGKSSGDKMKIIVWEVGCKYRVTQKKGTFEKPNKNWRNPRKKIYWQKLNHYNLPFKRQ